MPEVLSQSQIDALLNAVRSGEKDLDQSKQNAEEKKYRKYDFSRPRKFTKDRIKMLSSVFENYTRIINTRLNSTLHTACEIEVTSVEEQKYYEFVNALGEGDVLALADVDVKDKPMQEPIVLYISTQLALGMIDHMLGGEGMQLDTLPSDYNYTNLELQIYNTLVEDMIAVMGGSWENYIPMTFRYTKTEINPTLVQTVGLDESVIIVDIKVQISQLSGRICVCFPGTLLTSIFSEIGTDSRSRKNVQDDRSDEIFDSLRESKLEIIASLASTQLALSDIYHLNVGDVIDLSQPKEAPVHLQIGGFEWFSGRIGTYKKNMAVKIDEIYYQAEQRSEQTG